MKSVEQREGFGLMFYVGDIRCFEEGVKVTQSVVNMARPDIGYLIHFTLLTC